MANMPAWLTGMVVTGIYRTLAWVVSVMLPPMALFFPLFTLLEDSGYLPRIAFNLDHYFKKAHAHGKQALTTCMGFGCNACGVMGCRIIDSPRERLIAILTNSFGSMQGRFPTIISIITNVPFGRYGGGRAAFHLFGAYPDDGHFAWSCNDASCFSPAFKNCVKRMPSFFCLDFRPIAARKSGKSWCALF